jgi:site-specific DNA-methyltransferase (adenine-specific)
MTKIEVRWSGACKDEKNFERIHPCQRPLKLYTKTLSRFAGKGFKILDTHMGSQSLRIAAFNMGFDYWGYELDIDYFNAGNKRFKEQTAQSQLFQ